MKRTVLCWLIFFSFCLAAQSQLQLNPGQSWSYSFNTLPLTGSVSIFGNEPNGQLELTVRGAGLGPLNRLLYEMFEDTPSGTAVASGRVDAGVSAIVSCQSLGAWQDLQGSIKFTMEAGSAFVDSVTLQAIISGPSLSSYEVHSDTFVPVPEPGSWALLAVGAGVAMVWGRKRLGSTVRGGR